YQVISEYNLLTQSRFNWHMRQAHVAGFPAPDLGNVHLLDQLKLEERVLAERRDARLSEAAMARLQRAAQRMPTKGNLARLVFARAYRDEPEKMCNELQSVFKFYGEDTTKA